MRELLFILLTRFLPLNQEELELCESDPQEFVQQQLLESYQYDIKAAAKFLWLAMNRNFKALPPMALEIISSFLQAPSDPNNMQEFILRKEACYHGLSLCYNEFSSLIPFPSFFESMILPDSKRKEKEYQLIKQQICNMLCEGWAADLAQQLPECLRMLVQFLQEDNYIVSVWGSIAFRNVCNGYTLRNLDRELFHNFASEAVRAMLPLSHKLQNDSITTVVIENMGRLCVLLSDQLSQGIGAQVIQGLFTLWQHGANSSILRNAVLRCVATVISAGGSRTQTKDEHDQVERDLAKLILLSTDVRGTDTNMTYTTEGVRVWLAMAERNETKENCWILHRYPSELKERLGELLCLSDMLPHIDPQLFIPLLEHHTVLLFPSFFTSHVSQVTSFLGHILVSPKKTSWKVSAFAVLFQTRTLTLH